MTTPQAYPLQWPAGWPRTATRERGSFRTDLARALSNLRHELGLMGAADLVLSSNCTLGSVDVKDPGVCAYFTLPGKAPGAPRRSLAIPCDRWQSVAHNIHAIALTVEAMRGMQRWGASSMIDAMFSGFKALPSAGRHWSTVLGVGPNASVEEVEAGYKAKAKVLHPDAGGSVEAFQELGQAWATFKAERNIR